MKTSRRKFIRGIVNGLGLSVVLGSLYGCEKKSSIKGMIVGPNATLGHRLRTMDFPPPTETLFVDTVVVGGGIAGLAAARQLKKGGVGFLLLELDEETGGNSRGGTNLITAFPWGAHYVPLPSLQNIELIEFFKDVNIITGMSNDLPVYNEYFLCHDPKERLFINNLWQDSLIPHEGVPQKDRDQIQHFLTLMHDFKSAKGLDGREAFCIPVNNSSQDEQFLKLDQISAKDFLSQHSLDSPYLHWYVNYCCADDYGTSLSETSAWAMVHYFASRKGSAANAASDAVLTWPEGNYWLVKKLRDGMERQIRTEHLVYNVSLNQEGVEILCYDAKGNHSKKIQCNAVILATPQNVNQRLLSSIKRELDYKSFDYSPWMVANITTDYSLVDKRGEQLCWDNVIYGSDSLGYVNALHQQIGITKDKRKTLTYYKPLTSHDSVVMRKMAHEAKFEDWTNIVLDDLKKPHPGIQNAIEEMNIWVWGHGMVKPSPGFVWSENRKLAGTAIENKIFFAHSDVSGISIFEEAFHNGHQSAVMRLRHG